MVNHLKPQLVREALRFSRISTSCDDKQKTPNSCNADLPGGSLVSALVSFSSPLRRSFTRRAEPKLRFRMMHASFTLTDKKKKKANDAVRDIKRSAETLTLTQTRHSLLEEVFRPFAVMTEKREEVSGHVEVELRCSTITKVVREDHLTNDKGKKKPRFCDVCSQ